MRGLERFRRHFRDVTSQFVLIGGVAADAWFARAGIVFRATKDVDVVLLVEALDDAFLRRMWEFIRLGRYERKERGDGRRTYYRFTKPADDAFPAVLELFARAPAAIHVPDDQSIVPIPAGEDASSLSAILMDEDYYELVRANRGTLDDLPYVTPECLIALKACAWGELSARGNVVDEKHVTKHRNDVFRLALLLPVDGRMVVPARVLADMRRFLDAFPANAPEWAAIEDSMRSLGARWPGRAAVLDVLARHFASA